MSRPPAPPGPPFDSARDAAIVAALAPRIGPVRAARIDRVVAARLLGVEAVLEDLRDPHNGGAALRSCESMGVLSVHVIARLNPFRTSARVTQGAEKWLDIRRWREPAGCADDLAQRAVPLWVGVLGAPRSLADLDVSRPLALAFGNEHTGLSPQLRARATGEFTIPMHGFSQSLNVSVSVAVTLHAVTEARRSLLGRTTDLDDAHALALRARYYALDVRGASAIVDRYLDDAPPNDAQGGDSGG